MARARNIKPSFFLNEELVELPFETRLLFIGLWTIADRAGRLLDRPKTIKMQLFPADNVDVGESLNQLSEKGLIVRYTVENIGYIAIPQFSKHQNPHKDEKQSTYPAPNLHSTSTVQVQCESGTAPADSFLPITDSLPPIKPAALGYSEEFEQAWAEYPRRPGENKKNTFKAWSARINKGASAEDMIQGARAYAAYCKALQTASNFIKQPETFFGPSEHYLADWTPPANTGRGNDGKNGSSRRNGVADTIRELTGANRTDSRVIEGSAIHVD